MLPNRQPTSISRIGLDIKLSSRNLDSLINSESKAETKAYTFTERKGFGAAHEFNTFDVSVQDSFSPNSKVLSAANSKDKFSQSTFKHTLDRFAVDSGETLPA